ncbi:hypothetical protein ACJMK2_039840 [Sinanodonta woodiana]|uniref:Choline transporter-like protein n=1 Tax=Sinanodonta woodiana TaxID=1069815 RepID=A0ABD3WGJ1_SINWO
MCGGKEENQDNKYGEAKKHNKDFKGPIKNRSCTDVICCMLFLIFVAGMVACSIAGYVRGDPVRLLYPTNSDGLVCGVGTQVGRPNLMYFDLLKCTTVLTAINGCPTPSVCVKQCATENLLFASNFGEMLCKDGVQKPTTYTEAYNAVKDEKCAPYFVKSTPIVGRCIPSIFKDIFDKALPLLDSNGTVLKDAKNNSVTGDSLDKATVVLAEFFKLKEYGELVFKDIMASWWLILVCLGIASVVCFIWIILLRFIVGFIVWLTIAIFIGVWVFATYYSYTRYFELKNQNVTSELGLSQAFALNFSYYLSIKQTWLAFGCTSASLLIIFLLIFLFLVKRICIAIELIKEGSRAIGNMIFTLIWPIFPFILQLGFIGYYAASAVYIASMGSAQYFTNDTDRISCSVDSSALGKVCEFVKYGGDQYTIPLEVFMLFMFFWVMNFIVAFGQMTLAGAFASYYWAFEKPQDVPLFPLTASVYRSLRYHLGSLAFGSLLIAIVQIIRVFLEYIDHKLKGSENPVGKFLIKCLKCCMYCLEKILRYLTRNAYIMIAVYGKNFCSSAKDAFFLIMRNVVRVFVLDKVTDFVLFLSKMMVTMALGVAAYYGFQQKIPFFADYVPKLNYFLTPVIVIVVGTYLIASCFFNVYEMAIDTLFLCFLEDLEMNDGTPEKPYYMSKGLMKILGKKNKIQDPADTMQLSKAKKH